MKTLPGFKIKEYVAPIYLFIHAFFFLVFSSISILNHFYYRSSGLDYGLSNQALYQYAHFKSAVISQLLNGENTTYLSCHLSFWVPLLSPFYWIFGSYTLLLFQNLALVFAGLGLVKLGEYFTLKKGVLVFVLLQFYASFAIYAALAFDYHDNVIGACFLPWLFYFYQKQNYRLSILCFLALLISKENMAILLGFTAFTLWFTQPQFKWTAIKMPFLLFVAALTWFLLASIWIMPALNNKGQFDQLSRFSHLGSSLSEIVQTIFTHPYKMFRLFFESHIQPDSEERVKQEFLWVLLFSGGIALVRKPAFLWMALPILMQKLWNKELAFWGMSYHYQIELAPIISLALLFWLKSCQSFKWQIILSVFLFLATLSITLVKMDSRYSTYTVVKENVLIRDHYLPEHNLKKIRLGLAKIPADSAICAQSNLLPHLSNRTKAYHFPIQKDARYIVYLDTQANTYPLSKADADTFIQGLIESRNWKLDSTYSPLRILIRKN